MRAHPAPAQARHLLVSPRLPLPPHWGHGPDGCATETVPLPPQTRHEMMYASETARVPVPEHHAHVSGV
jgi:hypothetical protein